MLVGRRLGPLMAGMVAASLVLGACGGDDDGGSPAGPGGFGARKDGATQASGSGASSGTGSCEVNLTGDVKVSWKGRGGASAAGSDYWYSDDEMKKMLGVMKSSKESVDDAMKKDPRLFLLILNCTSSEGGGKNSVSILPSGDSKYKDVPFQAGEYAIPVQGALGGAAKPGDFGVLLSVGEGAYRVVEAGKLKITKFDKSGIAGSFSYKGEEVFGEGKPKVVNVEGKFEFRCPAGENCKK